MIKTFSWPPGKVIDGRYQVVTTLGSGGMGAVLHVRDLTDQQEYAMKVVIPDSDFNDLEERFMREIIITRNVSHPNVVQTHGSGKAENGAYYLIMELLAPGEDLAAIIDLKGQLPQRLALAYTKQILEGLKACHEKDIVHRDLKPQNLRVVNWRGQDLIVITDFGLARFLKSSEPEVPSAGLYQTSPSRANGSPIYMAPEAFTSPGDVDVRSDLYSVGITLYEMLTGTPPWSGRSTMQLMGQHVYTDVPPLSKRCNTELHPVIERFVLTLLAKKREDRYQDCDQVLTFIKQIETALGWTKPEP